MIEDVTEDTILGTVKRASEKSNFVIVDLEGTASMTVAYAISRADLVIIPSQGSHLDAEQGAKAVRLVRKQEEAFNLSIPMAILFTRTSAAIRTRDLKRIEGNFAKAQRCRLQCPSHRASTLSRGVCLWRNALKP